MLRILSRMLPVMILFINPARALGDTDEQELAALESLLEQETEIVTRTRMNRDFVPGMVSVLQGETLRTLGARTVADALPYVPGVQLTLDARGAPSATVRGIAFPFNSGNIRIMIDGVPIARESAGQNIGSALLLPLSQVERLEFIRGPGSVVYGDFAFQGLLNIVSRDREQALIAETDSRETLGGNVMFNVGDEDWQASLNAAGNTSTDALVAKGAQGDENRHSVFAKVSRGGLSVQLAALGRDVDITGTGPRSEESNLSVSSRYEWAHSEALTGMVRLRYLHNDFDGETISSFKGDELAGGIEFNWTGWENQDWLFGAEYTESDVDQSSFFTAASPGSSPGQSPAAGVPGLRPPPGPNPGVRPPPVVPGQNLLSFTGDDREVVSVFAQGQFELHPTLHFVAGARYDDVQFIGERVTPRGSLVWQATDHHIFKAQYAEGFRGPTFFERAGASGSFDFEVNKTAELSYIYRRPGLVFRGTVYDSQFEDMVFSRPSRGFGNFASAKARGIELELSKRLGSALSVEANASAVDSEDDRNTAGQSVASGAIPDWMANLGVIWNVSTRTAVAAHWNHISDRESAAPRSGSMDVVDIALTVNDVLARGLTIRFGVTNVFNEDVIHIIDGPADRVNDFDTRTAWATASWSW